jgi:hypothetical protein
MRRLVDGRAGVVHVPEAAHVVVALELFVGQALGLERPGRAQAAGAGADDAGGLAAVNDAGFGGGGHGVSFVAGWIGRRAHRLV